MNIWKSLIVGLLAMVFTTGVANAQPSVQERYTPFRGNAAAANEAYRKLSANPKIQIQNARPAATPSATAAGPATTPRAAAGGRRAPSPTPPTTFAVNTRIINGVPASIANHPWQVALIWAAGSEPARAQFCGGSLIAPNWVVTAAHCVDRGRKPEEVDIVAGTAVYKVGGQRVSIKQIFVHPQWNDQTMENDVALLKLARNATLGASVKTIQMLGTGSVLPLSAKLNVTGWGVTENDPRGSDILMGADMPIVDLAVCNQPDSYNGRLKPGMFCAGLVEGGVDSCQGDSGGPATVVVNQAARLAGIVSWGEGCALALKYGVYTRVPVYADWIRQTRLANP